jgi:hypothetical protein
MTPREGRKLPVGAYLRHGGKIFRLMGKTEEAVVLKEINDRKEEGEKDCHFFYLCDRNRWSQYEHIQSSEGGGGEPMIKPVSYPEEEENEEDENDRNTIERILTRAGFVFETEVQADDKGENINVWAEDNEGRDNGLDGFFTVFDFDRDGRLRSIGTWQGSEWR